MVKPFSYAELIARVKALLRRYCIYQGKGQPGATYEDDTLSAQGITICPGSQPGVGAGGGTGI